MFKRHTTSAFAVGPRTRQQTILAVAAAALGLACIACVTAFAYVRASPALLVGAVVLAALTALVVHRSLTQRFVDAMRLALTDPLTGLGNARHFLERLERDLDRAQADATELTLVLIDVDDFKSVNDRYGHAAGDRVLVEVARCLRRGGEAFRLGGDEFALLLPERATTEGLAVAEAVLARIATADHPHGGVVTASGGVATFPGPGIGRGELVRAADEALYRSKHLGKDCVRDYRPDLEAAPPATLAAKRDRDALLQAAAGLARAVRARGIEATRIGEIAGRIATRLGLSPEQVELIRLAGDVSDVGKLAVPDDVLRKPGPLSELERVAVEQHAEIGHAMLDSLGVDPLAMWVRHHHERWDGGGYPGRLAGERIPLAARILFVADALDSMTTDQTWRPSLSLPRALHELERCAGTQFDPAVVSAVLTEFAAEAGRPTLRTAAA